MKIIKLTLLAVCVFGIFSACSSKDLSDGERNIINENISDDLYQEQIDEIGQQLAAYLTESVNQYIEYYTKQAKKDISEYRASKALLGGGWDLMELFGTNTETILVQRHNDFITYINNHIDDLEEMAIGMTKILSKNPDFIKKYNLGFENYIPLEIFSSLKNVPYSIPVPVNSSEGEPPILTLDMNDMEGWGKGLMGNPNKPQLSIPLVLEASVLAVENVLKPKPVYAVYDDETKSWDVGYDTEQAVNVKFKTKGDIINYECSLIPYQDAYRQSELNVLNIKKK